MGGWEGGFAAGGGGDRWRYRWELLGGGGEGVKMLREFQGKDEI
jgi:hypothetical protein